MRKVFRQVRWLSPSSARRLLLSPKTLAFCLTLLLLVVVKNSLVRAAYGPERVGTVASREVDLELYAMADSDLHADYGLHHDLPHCYWDASPLKIEETPALSKARLAAHFALVIVVDCATDGVAALNATLTSIASAQFTHIHGFPDHGLELIFSVNAAVANGDETPTPATESCLALARDFDFSAYGNKKVLLWDCRFESRMLHWMHAWHPIPMDNIISHEEWTNGAYTKRASFGDSPSLEFLRRHIASRSRSGSSRLVEDLRGADLSIDEIIEDMPAHQRSMVMSAGMPAALILDSGTVFGHRFLFWARDVVSEYRGGFRGRDTFGGIFRPTIEASTNVVPEAFVVPTSRDCRFSRAELRRPTPGHLSELLVFARPFATMREHIGEHMNSVIEKANDGVMRRVFGDPWQRSTLAWIAAECHRQNLYLVSPCMSHAGSLAMTVSQVDASPLTPLPTDLYGKSHVDQTLQDHKTSLVFATLPCRYEWDGAPRMELSLAAKESHTKEGFVGVRMVNASQVTSTLSWLCQTAKFDKVHRHTVLLALDEDAYESLRHNAFHVHVIPAFESRDNALIERAMAASDLPPGILPMNSVAYPYERARIMNLLTEMLACHADVFVHNDNALWLDNVYKSMAAPPLQMHVVDDELGEHDVVNREVDLVLLRRDNFTHTYMKRWDEDFFVARHTSRSVNVLSWVARRYSMLADEWTAYPHHAKNERPIWIRPVFAEVLAEGRIPFYLIDKNQLPTGVRVKTFHANDDKSGRRLRYEADEHSVTSANDFDSIPKDASILMLPNETQMLFSQVSRSGMLICKKRVVADFIAAIGG